MSSQCQVISHLHAMTYLTLKCIKFMVTYSWALFVSKDVPIYVHHMQPSFGKEIIYCPRYAMYTLLTVIQESKFMRVHMVLWLLFCINICLKSISVGTKIVHKTFLFPIKQVTIQCSQENSPKTALKSIFHYIFAKSHILLEQFNPN